MILVLEFGNKLSNQIINFPYTLHIEDNGMIDFFISGEKILFKCNKMIRNKKGTKEVVCDHLFYFEYIPFYVPFTVSFYKYNSLYSNYIKLQPNLSKITIGSHKINTIKLFSSIKAMNILIRKRKNVYEITDGSNCNHLYYESSFSNCLTITSGKVQYLQLTLFFYQEFIMLNCVEETDLNVYNHTSYDIRPRKTLNKSYQLKFHSEYNQRINVVKLKGFIRIQSPSEINGLNQVPQRVMALSALSVAIINFNNGMLQNRSLHEMMPSLIFPITMCFSAILWPSIAKIINKKNHMKALKNRNIEYKEYIDFIYEKYLLHNEKQKVMLEKRYPKDINFNHANVENYLFNHHYTHSDYLHFAIGYGMLKSNICFEFEKQPYYNKNDEELIHMQDDLMNKLAKIENGIIEIDLKKYQFIGIVQKHDSCLPTLLFCASQLFITHSYDNIRGCFIIDEDSLDKIQPFFYLKHLYSNDNNTRFIVTSKQQFDEIEKHLIDTLENHHLIVFIFNKSYRYSDSKSVFFHKNVRVIHVVDHDIQLNMFCEVKVELKHFNKITYLKENQSFEFSSTMSQYNIINFGDISLLSNKMINKANFGLFECYGINSVQQLKVNERWKDSKGICAILGCNNSNSKVVIDLHESKDGPHGLIAGSTGSGKSELLLTLILSLSINYSFEDVQFVLIDYKGGSSVLPLMNKNQLLPHIVGVITNQDGADIKRSLNFLKQECSRRQQLFIQATKQLQHSITNIDQYKNNIKENNLVKLAHLVLIVDEFAELKKEKPEFLQELISISRIGRSLGIHLILATQKPTGVVDEQILSNVNFKICLRVNDEQDSKEIIRNNLAAKITESGYFYLSTNRRNEFVKCAYTHKLRPHDSYKIEVLNCNFHPINSIIEDKESNLPEIKIIVPYLIEKCNNNQTQSLWPSVPVRKPLEQFDNKKMFIGIADDTENRTHFNFSYLCFQENCLCFSESALDKADFMQCIDENIVKNNYTAILLTNNKNEYEYNKKFYNEVIGMNEVDKIKRMFYLLKNKLDTVLVIIDDLLVFLQSIEYDNKILSMINNLKHNNIGFTCIIHSIANFRYSLISYFDVLISLHKMNRQQQISFFNQAAIYDNEQALFFNKSFYEFSLAIPRKVHGKNNNLALLYDLKISECKKQANHLILGFDKITNEPITLLKTKFVLVIGIYDDSLTIIKKHLISQKINVVELDNIQQKKLKGVHDISDWLVSNKVFFVVDYQKLMKSELRNTLKYDTVIWIGNGFWKQSIISTNNGEYDLLDDEGIVSVNGRTRRFCCFRG